MQEEGAESLELEVLLGRSGPLSVGSFGQPSSVSSQGRAWNTLQEDALSAADIDLVIVTGLHAYTQQVWRHTLHNPFLTVLVLRECRQSSS